MGEHKSTKCERARLVLLRACMCTDWPENWYSITGICWHPKSKIWKRSVQRLRRNRRFIGNLMKYLYYGEKLEFLKRPAEDFALIKLICLKITFSFRTVKSLQREFLWATFLFRPGVKSFRQIIMFSGVRSTMAKQSREDFRDEKREKTRPNSLPYRQLNIPF